MVVSIRISSVYFLILGSPIPAPKPRLRTLSGAVEKPSCIALSIGDSGALVSEQNFNLVGININVAVTAVGVDNHINLRLIHSDCYTADSVGIIPERFEALFNRAARFTGTGEIVGRHLVMKMYSVAHTAVPPESPFE